MSRCPPTRRAMDAVGVGTQARRPGWRLDGVDVHPAREPRARSGPGLSRVLAHLHGILPGCDVPLGLIETY